MNRWIKFFPRDYSNEIAWKWAVAVFGNGHAFPTRPIAVPPSLVDEATLRNAMARRGLRNIRRVVVLL
jgi:hypothetical protein